MYKFLCFCLSFVLIVGCKDQKNDKQNATKPTSAAPVSVDILIAKTTNLLNNIEVNGAVIANENAEVHPEVAGRLTYLNVADGARVSKGTILAKINDADLQAQLKKLKLQVQIAQKTEERLNKLLAVGGINQADYDIALSQYNNLKADIDIIQANIDKTIIKAPFDGILGLRKISPGAYVTPQNTITTLLQTNRVKIDFSVPEEFAAQMQKGKVLKISANNKILGATIIATEPEINETTRSLKVRATLNQGNLPAGSFVKIDVQLQSNNATSIVIPTNCIIPEDKTKKVVLVKNGKPLFVVVETGLRTADGVQITKGIELGDSIIITGVLFVRPNSEIKIRGVK